MTAIERIFERYGNQTVERLRESFARNNVNASGALSRSVESNVVQKGSDVASLQVSMFRYGLAAEDGRGPTKNSGPGNLLLAIRRWIDQKGIAVPQNKKMSMAYAITKKIHQQGTLKFRDPSKRDQSISSVINENLVDNIVSDVATAISKEVADEIVSAFTNRGQNGSS